MLEFQVNTPQHIVIEVNNLTRCILLDEWFNAMSKKIDKEELKTKKDFVTGGKKNE